MPTNVASLVKTYQNELQTRLAISKTEYLKRIRFYTYARLHPKQRPVNWLQPLVQETEQHKDMESRKLHHLLWAGRQWSKLLDIFSSVSQGLGHRDDNFKPYGLLCLLQKEYPWLRARPETQRAALAELCSKTDLYDQAKRREMLVCSDLKIEWERCTLRISSPSAAQPAPPFRSAGRATEPWKALSRDTSSRVVPGLRTEDGQLLVILLCFLNDCDVPVDLLHLGATSRKRWTEQGEIAETQPMDFGLIPELENLLSDRARLSFTLHELHKASALVKNHDGTWSMNAATRTLILGTLPSQVLQAWRQQALLLIYRSVPWKYLEPRPRSSKTLLDHLEHTVQAVRSRDGYSSLANTARIDLALTLIEASRLPGKTWKLSAIIYAEEVVRDMNDQYVGLCIAQRKSLVHRVSGNHDESVRALNQATLNLDLQGANIRMHVAAGQVVIQQAMNHFVNENLVEALSVLSSWHPRKSTPAENVLVFRMRLLRGKINRLQGHFEEALSYLPAAPLPGRNGDIFYEEDVCELLCETADTMLELDQTWRAEKLLRTHLAHQYAVASSARYLVELSLAESLFAQGRSDESRKLCLDIMSQTSVSKMVRLRGHITLAKLHHLESDWGKALEHWTQALAAINLFPPTSGLATRTIHLSICDVLHQQGNHDTETRSLRTVSTLKDLCHLSEAKYWIAGFRHWEEIMDTKSRC